MKIMTNTVGNYSPHINAVNKTKAPAKTIKVENKMNTRPAKNELTMDEKIFFMNMYPENKSEIKDYHFYKRNGEMSGVKIGSLLDRRG